MTSGIRHLREARLSDGTLLRVGDRQPLPRPGLDIRPASGADDPARSPRGVFRNGRGKA